MWPVPASVEALGPGSIEKRLRLRLGGREPRANAGLVAEGPKPGEFVSLRGVKLFADGALGSRGAWLKTPYSDAPDHRGIPILHGAALAEKVKGFAAKGWQP